MEQIDLQTRSMLGRVHDRYVDDPRRNLIDQILRHIDVYSKGNILKRAAHPSDPIEQKRLRKTDFAADGQNSATARWHGNLMKGALP